MMRSMLEAVAGGDVTRIADIQRYIKCTLLAATNGAEVLQPTRAKGLQIMPEGIPIDRERVGFRPGTELYRLCRSPNRLHKEMS